MTDCSFRISSSFFFLRSSFFFLISSLCQPVIHPSLPIVLSRLSSTTRIIFFVLIRYHNHTEYQGSIYFTILYLHPAYRDGRFFKIRLSSFFFLLSSFFCRLSSFLFIRSFKSFSLLPYTSLFFISLP